MPREILVSDLIKKIRWRTGQEYSKFIADDEMLSYIDDAACELHDLLIASFKDYYLEYADLTTEAETNVYTLPANFLKVRGVDLIDGGRTIKLDPFPFEEREKYINSSVSSISTNNMKYCIAGNTMILAPTPIANTSIRVWYTPCLPLLNTTTQSLSTFDGWHTLIIASVGAMIAAKAEESVTPFIKEKEEIIKRIEQAAAQRDVGEPSGVIDSTGVNDPYFINYPY